MPSGRSEEPFMAFDASVKEGTDGDVASTGRASRQIIAIGGGKGGSGKSMLASNLGIYLAQTGRRVVIVDGDFGGANLHTCLGIGIPRSTLSDFVLHRVESIEEVAVPTPIEGLRLISGAKDVFSAATPKHGQHRRILQQLQALDADIIILDLGSGTAVHILDFFLGSDLGIMVLLPEPTSLENGYRFLRSAFFRKVQRLEVPKHIKGIVDSAVDAVMADGLVTPLELLEAVTVVDVDAAEPIRAEMELFRPKLVLNQTRSQADRDLGPAIQSACRRKLGLEIDLLGNIDYDDSVWLSIRRRKPMLIEFPEAQSSRDLDQVARRILSLRTETRRVVKSVQPTVEDQDNVQEGWR